MKLPVLFLTFATLFAQDRPTSDRVAEVLRPNILAQAAWAMEQQPVTITDSVCPRSAGGKHDFYSEGDYWWPDPEHPDGPYIQRDGMTNPDNFVAHRQAMIRLSRVVGSLASGYRITGDEKYVRQAFRHVDAWFVNPDTRMNPSLEFAQAIKGRATGRGIGIIDTIHLMEVAQGIRVMERTLAADARVLTAAKDWFRQYLKWLTTHQYGQDEMKAKNNHGTCWVMQVASFARLTGDQELMDQCRNRFRTVLLPEQMAADGSFPQELRRTKPYGYSLFNLDAMAMICQILSDGSHDLWNYQTSDGKSVRKGISFLFPYVADKAKWPYSKDVMYWDNWPVAHPFLIFGALKLEVPEWFETWKRLDHSPEVEEVLRNLPVRNPLIWIENVRDANPSVERTIWMRQAKWGVMTHYLADWQARANSLEMSVEQWNKMVDGFDVEGLAEQLKSVGAGYHILTIGQNSGYYLAPNPTYDRLAGITPSRCSRRDLVSDMAMALAKRGIRLIVYLPAGAPNGDRVAREALQWQNGMFPNREFQLKWEQIIRDWSLRFGGKISGWWFDGCYWPNLMYRSPQPPNFASFAEAARAGNPNSALAFNPGVVPRLISLTPEEDYTAGEISNPERLEIRRAQGGLLDGRQIQILSYLGRTWGMGEPRFNVEQAIGYSQAVWREAGAATWDVPVGMNGLIPEPFIAQLKAIGRGSLEPLPAK